MATTVSVLISCTLSPQLCTSIRLPFWLTQRRRPRPTSCRFAVLLSECFKVQIWNTFGLSQPSRRAEWEKMNRVGSSKDSSRSLFLRIRSYAETSFSSKPSLFALLSMLRPVFLSMLKYPLCTRLTSLQVDLKYFWYGVSSRVAYSFRTLMYSCSNI